MKFQDVFLGLGTICVLALAILSYVPLMIFRSGPHPMAREKACYANMRVLLGSVEMYNMDHSIMLDRLTMATISDLHTKGYLKSPQIECPGDVVPRYTNAFVQARMETLSRNIGKTGLAFINTPGGIYGGTNLASDGVIVCSMHGTVE